MLPCIYTCLAKKKNGNASTKGINPGQPAESIENDIV